MIPFMNTFRTQLPMDLICPNAWRLGELAYTCGGRGPSGARFRSP
jgi:hypothetical protein